MGRWAKWAAKPEHLDKPISGRTGESRDPFPEVSLSKRRASEHLYYVIAQKMQSIPKVGSIMKANKSECGLDVWREVAQEMGKLSWKALTKKQAWIMAPPSMP